MVILIVFIVGLVLLVMPLLHPLSSLLQRLFSLPFSQGIRSYTHLTLRNNHKRVLTMQRSLLFGYAIILFIDTIAVSQASMLIINLKYYYGSAFTLSPSKSSVSEVQSLLHALQSDPLTNQLHYGWLSKSLTRDDSSATLHTLGRVKKTPVRMWDSQNT